MAPPRLSPTHVGRRVVVRHRLPDGSATDLLGELVALDADGAQVLPDDGPPVRVAAEAVLAAKPVPPRQVRPSSSIADVVRVSDLGWPGLERERLGGWVLRASGGFTGRGNSVLPLGDPGLPLPAAVDAVERFYAARDLPARFSVPTTLDPAVRADPAPGVDAELDARGYARVDESLVLVTDLRHLADPDDAADATWSPEPDAGFTALYRYRGGALPPVAVRVLTAAQHQEFLTLRRDGEPVAVGRVAVARGWAGVTAMEVAPSARRQGLGRQVLLRLLARGRELGARWGYLQVAAENTAARNLYAATGLTPHHGYHYRVQPVGQPVQVTASSGM